MYSSLYFFLLWVENGKDCLKHQQLRFLSPLFLYIIKLLLFIITYLCVFFCKIQDNNLKNCRISNWTTSTFSWIKRESDCSFSFTTIERYFRVVCQFCVEKCRWKCGKNIGSASIFELCVSEVCRFSILADARQTLYRKNYVIFVLCIIAAAAAPSYHHHDLQQWLKVNKLRWKRHLKHDWSSVWPKVVCMTIERVRYNDRVSVFVVVVVFRCRFSFTLIVLSSHTYYMWKHFLMSSIYFFFVPMCLSILLLCTSFYNSD